MVGGNNQHHFHRHEILLPNKITERPKAMLTSLWNIYVKNRIHMISSLKMLSEDNNNYCIYNVFMGSAISGVHKCTNLTKTWWKIVGYDNNYYYDYNLHFSLSTEMFTFS